MTLRSPLLLASASALCLLSQSALAQNIDSAYTKINLDQCTDVTSAIFGDLDPDEMGTVGGAFACVGYDNSLVLVSEGDLRFFISYGDNAVDQFVWGQTLPAFNYLNDTMEWRLIETKKGWQPFATIIRYFTDSGDGSGKEGQILVVTKLEEGNSCHIAYVDALLMPDANVVARNFADQFASDFQCGVDEIMYAPT